jgi:drug/metabolite transporter (DMT)-like permease
MLAAVALGLGASACWAVANVAVQRSARRVGTFRALLWAQVVGAVLVAMFVPLLDRREAPLTLAVLPWVVAAGAAALVAYVCLFYAFEHGRLTLAVPVMSGWSVIAAGVSLVMFAAPVRPLHLVGAACVVTGALVVSRYAQRHATAPAPPMPAAPTSVSASMAGGARTPRWLLASAGAAVGFGLLIPAIGRLAPTLGALGAIAVVYAMDVVLGLPLAWRYRIGLAPPPRAAWLPVVLAGLFETAGFACIALGGRHASLALVSPLASLASAFTVLYAWIVLGERPAGPVLLGAALACGGVVALAL